MASALAFQARYEGSIPFTRFSKIIMDFSTSIGALGALLLLIAFILNETHLWSENERRYDAMNLIGAALLVVYAWLIRSYPFLVLNAVWALVALRDTLKRK